MSKPTLSEKLAKLYDETDRWLKSPLPPKHQHEINSNESAEIIVDASNHPCCEACLIPLTPQVKKHHCKSCQRRFCGKCSSVEVVTDLLVGKSSYHTNSTNLSDGGNSNNNNKFRLCHDCHDIFTVADDIFAMVQNRKQKMFNNAPNQRTSSQVNVAPKGLNNTAKSHCNNSSFDDGDKENTDNNNMTTNYYISPNKHYKSTNIAAVKSIRSPLKASTTKNDNINNNNNNNMNEVNNVQFPRLLQPPPPPPKPLKKIFNDRIQYNPLGNGYNPNDNPEPETNPEFWYHDDLAERDRMLKSIYVKPSSDANNAYYFVGTQRIVRRARPTVN